MISQSELLTKLTSAFPDAVIHIQDLAGDNNHYRVILKSEIFKNKSRVTQHQMVYSALGDIMRSQLHALSIETGV